MLLGIILWILAIGGITLQIDVVRQDSINKMSNEYHFIFLGILIAYLLNLFYNIVLPKKKKDLFESFMWIIFIATISMCCYNPSGDDIETGEYFYFSLGFLYIIYLYKLEWYPKEEALVLEKSIFIIVFFLVLLWPGLQYLSPWSCEYPDNFDWTGWPYIPNLPPSDICPTIIDPERSYWNEWPYISWLDFFPTVPYILDLDPSEFDWQEWRVNELMDHEPTYAKCRLDFYNAGLRPESVVKVWYL